MSKTSEIKEVSSRHLGRTYYILDFLKKAKIAETVNKYTPNSDYNIDVEGKGNICFTLGQIFEIMTINRLYGFTTPLYHIGEWCKNTAIPEIYGIPWELLNDDRIGRFLDKIYPHLATIDSQITLSIIKKFVIETNAIHFDPSSFSVHGDYLPIAGETTPIKVTYGRDGQGSTSNKIVRFGIAITQDSGIPLFSQCYSGNTNDSYMHPDFLIQLRDSLATSNFLFIADTKFDVKENFLDIFRSKGRFLCPGVFSTNIKKDFLKYSQKHEFKELKYSSESDKKKPKNKRPKFKAFEVQKQIVGKNSKGKKCQYKYRLIFIYSSTKAKAEEKSRKKSIAKVIKDLTAIVPKLNNRKLVTRDEIMKKLIPILSRSSCKKFFNVNLEEKDEKFSLKFNLKEKEIETARELDGIYVLKTNLTKKEYSTNEVLALYKKQSKIETRMADIKDPLHVAPIYLEKPERILSLFTIIIQALKIYTLIEREVHKAIDENEEGIPILPENRISKRPKGSSILRIFDDHIISLTTITFGSGFSKTYLSPLSEKQKMLFRFVERKPPDQRTFSRKIGVYKIASQTNFS